METQKEKLKAVREEAERFGMTFKKDRHTVNGQQGFKFVDRRTGIDLSDMWTVESAYSYMREMSFSNIKL